MKQINAKILGHFMIGLVRPVELKLLSLNKMMQLKNHVYIYIRGTILWNCLTFF